MFSKHKHRTEFSESRGVNIFINLLAAAAALGVSLLIYAATLPR